MTVSVAATTGYPLRVARLFVRSNRFMKEVKVMYVNPVLFGVLVTVGVEIVALMVYSIYQSRKKK